MRRGFGHTPYGRTPYGDPFYLIDDEPDPVVVLDEPDPLLVASYQEVYAESLPPGPLWDVDRDVGLRDLLEGLSREKTRTHVHLEKILVETNPVTTDEMLSEWEEVFGLPDECAPPALSRSARQAAVRGAFLATGGQTEAYYINLVEQVFGAVVTIATGHKTPFTTSDGTGSDIPPFSGSVVGDTLWEYTDWFEWKVYVNQTDDLYDGSEMGDRLVCLLERTKPAHTTVVVEYVIGVS